MKHQLEITINTLDGIVLGILVLSALIACFRGFLREFLSLGAWVGAALVTLYCFPDAADLLHHYTKSDKLAQAGGAILIFICALIGFSILGSLLVRYAKSGSEVGALDNLLGLVFGILRGAFIVCFGYLILLQVVPQHPQPEWLQGALTRPYLQSGSDALLKIAPSYMVNVKSFAEKREEDHEDGSSHDTQGMPALHPNL